LRRALLGSTTLSCGANDTNDQEHRLSLPFYPRRHPSPTPRLKTRRIRQLELRLQTSLLIRTRHDINEALRIAIVVVVKVHGAVFADLASDVGAERSVPNSSSAGLGSRAAVWVAGSCAASVALVDVEGPGWGFAGGEALGGCCG
jgi:hypothetical protein